MQGEEEIDGNEMGGMRQEPIPCITMDRLFWDRTVNIWAINVPVLHHRRTSW